MPLCSQTKLILNFDGVDGATTTTDSSPSPVAITVGAGDSISTAQAVAGGSSFKVTGVASLTADAAKLTLGSSDFSIECWARVDSTLNSPIATKTEIWRWSDDATGSLGLEFLDWDTNPGNTGSIRLRGNVPDPGITVATGLVLMDTWNHVVMTRQVVGANETIRVFLNGVQVYSNSQALVAQTGTVGRFRLGNDTGSRSLKGYMDEFRLVVGSPVYTAAFTPPGAAVCDSIADASTMSTVPVFVRRYIRRRK